MTDTTTDIAFMQQALRLATRGQYSTDPNPRVGCVLVHAGEVVGRGWHQWAGQAHAEVNALAAAGERAKGATAYVTLEPCSHTGKTPPCADALIRAGVKRVVVAMQDPNPQVAGRGLARLRAQGIETVSGVLEPQARALNQGFVKRMTTGRPYVRVKLGASLDGRTAMASGESQWITGEAARADVQLLRAQSSAILTGVGTVLADNPALTVRRDLPDLKQPQRVVLDSRLRTPPGATVLQGASSWLLTTAEAAAENAGRAPSARVDPAAVHVLDDHQGRVSLDAVMRFLGEREINLLHVEAGATLGGALLQAGLVDEIVLYVAPVLLGDDARGLFHLPGLTAMKHKVTLSISDVRQVGDDLRIGLKPTPSS